jgi:hypothetical protein
MLTDKGNTNKDQKEIDALISRFFSLFTNKNGAIPQVAEIHSMFIKEGIIISNSESKPAIFHLDEFIQPRLEMLTNGTLVEFMEAEVSHKTEIYNGIAQRWSYYEKSGVLNGVTFKQKGMKTFQFIKVNEEWMIVSVAWSDE